MVVGLLIENKIANASSYQIGRKVMPIIQIAAASKGMRGRGNQIFESGQTCDNLCILFLSQDGGGQITVENFPGGILSEGAH